MWKLKYQALTLLIGLACCSPLAGQQPPHCAQVLFCLFNLEALASGPSGFHKYSEDLTGLILPNPEENSSFHQVGSRLAVRLADAEQAGRARGNSFPKQLSSKPSMI
jgi:hypothetical protein